MVGFACREEKCTLFTTSSFCTRFSFVFFYFCVYIYGGVSLYIKTTRAHQHRRENSRAHSCDIESRFSSVFPLFKCTYGSWNMAKKIFFRLVEGEMKIKVHTYRKIEKINETKKIMSDRGKKEKGKVYTWNFAYERVYLSDSILMGRKIA